MAKRSLAVLPPLDGEDWRVMHAAALEADVHAIERWLDATTVVEELFREGGDDAGAAALRSIAGAMRERRDDRGDEIRRLRAAVAR